MPRHPREGSGIWERQLSSACSAITGEVTCRTCRCSCGPTCCYSLTGRRKQAMLGDFGYR
eukprot:9433275-Pyramimonas_sp.AAC.1